MIFQLFQLGTRGIFIFGGGNKRLRNITKMYCQCQISHKRRKKECLQSIPFKNAVDVASNGERFTLTNAANLKTYIPSKINKKKVTKELTIVVF
jgi:hypothetical protein